MAERKRTMREKIWAIELPAVMRKSGGGTASAVREEDKEIKREKRKRILIFFIEEGLYRGFWRSEVADGFLLGMSALH